MSFRLNPPKQPAKAVAETPAKKPAFSIGKPKVQKPAQTLTARFEEAKQTQSNLNSLVGKKVEAEPKASGLGNLLANKPVPHEEQVAAKEVATIKLAEISEKYVLNADATEKLPQTVLDDFTAKMQHLIFAMDTQELQTALHSVLNFAQENPHLRDILRAEDIQLVVRAARKSYGLTVVAKTKGKTRTTKKAALDADIMADLADVSFTI